MQNSHRGASDRRDEVGANLLTAVSLQINGLASPLGIDDSALRLSWQLSSVGRGLTQTAFRIQVASAADKLQYGDADVWDSGVVPGSTQHIDYAGPELAGCTRYSWQVSIKDAEGQWSESAPVYFDTGLRDSDWQAKWIWRSRRVRVNDFAYFRKEIHLRKVVAYAKMFVSAHNFVQPYIDGVRIGGFGSPAPTNPLKRKYYLAYDVTDLLHPGKVCLSAVAHYLGGSGQNYVNGLPGFRLQLEVIYTDGARQTFKTDATWETLKDMPHLTGTDYQQKRGMSAVEDYDARKLQQGWQLVGLDKAFCRKAALAQDQIRDWPMKWQAIPEGAEEECLAPSQVTAIVALRDGRYRSVAPQDDTSEIIRLADRSDGVQVFDVGKIVSGWPRISLKGTAGTVLQMRYSEDLDENGRVRHYVCNETSAHYLDRYTMRGDGLETWQPDLSYKAFRYVEVTGSPVPLVPGEHFWVASAHTDLVQEGSFNCSNELLNAMYTAIMQTQKNNTLGQMVDCPHREQAQYLADTDLQAEALLYNFEAGHLLEKTISDFTDGQLADGTFPFVYPTNVASPRFSTQIPEWDLHYCTLLWKIYEMSGDARILDRYYKPAKRMADYYTGLIDETGLVPLDKGWHISDWPYPTVDHSSDYLTVQNIKLYAALRIIADIAVMFGYVEDEQSYRRMAERMHKSIVKQLYDRKLKRFRDCLGSAQTHQGVNAIALYYGLVPEADREVVIDYIATTAWEAKTVLSLPLLRVLFDNGREQEAYDLISRDTYPGWGYMIAQGASTMWEGWDDIESHSHAWNGYPIRLLQEYVVGIRPLRPGSEEIRIKPYMPADLSFAEATVPTVRGTVSVRWERAAAGTFKLAVRIPAGIRASIVLPCESAGSLSESGETVWTDGQFVSGVSGIQHCELTGDTLVIKTGSGHYEFNIYLS